MKDYFLLNVNILPIFDMGNVSFVHNMYFKIGLFSFVALLFFVIMYEFWNEI